MSEKVPSHRLQETAFWPRLRPYDVLQTRHWCPRECEEEEAMGRSRQTELRTAASSDLHGLGSRSRVLRHRLPRLAAQHHTRQANGDARSLCPDVAFNVLGMWTLQAKDSSGAPLSSVLPWRREAPTGTSSALPIERRLAGGF